MNRTPALVIGLIQQKGGVGKTTLSLNLAAWFAKQKRKVLVIDADPQASASEWAAARATPPIFSVVAIARANLHRDLADIAAGYDVVIIDGAPRSNDLARSAILASDHILIPVQPSPFDVWAARQIVALIDAAREFRPDINASFVITRRIGKSVIGREVAGAFAEQPFPLVPVSITQRIVFPESAAAGLTVIEAEPDGEASREIGELARWLTTSMKRNAA